MSDVSLEKEEGQTQTYQRFDRSQRIEHILFLTAFTVLGITGLAQKFATSPGGGLLIQLMGGIETTRIIHRSAAIVLMVVSIYHILGLLYRVFVRRVNLSIMPVLQDLRDLIQDVLFYIGLRNSLARRRR
jgi:cytochrome b subunit of formate dehydrogenase